MSVNKPYQHISELSSVIPVFPLENVLLLPQSQLPLNIFEPRYLSMIDDAVSSDRLIGLIQPVQDQTRLSTVPVLESIGCVGRITQFGETGDGRYMITLTGVTRFTILQELELVKTYRRCRVSYDAYGQDLQKLSAASNVDRIEILRMLKLFKQSRGLRIDKDAIEKTPDSVLINALSMQMQFKLGERQALLEAKDIEARAAILIGIAELEFAEMSGTRTGLQ